MPGAGAHRSAQGEVGRGAARMGSDRQQGQGRAVGRSLVVGARVGRASTGPFAIPAVPFVFAPAHVDRSQLKSAARHSCAMPSIARLTSAHLLRTRPNDHPRNNVSARYGSGSAGADAGAAAVHPRAAGSPRPTLPATSSVPKKRRQRRRTGVRGSQRSFVDGGARRVLRVLRPHLRGLRWRSPHRARRCTIRRRTPCPIVFDAALRDDREEGDDALH